MQETIEITPSDESKLRKVPSWTHRELVAFAKEWDETREMVLKGLYAAEKKEER